jgi:hypothetical protein
MCAGAVASYSLQAAAVGRQLAMIADTWVVLLRVWTVSVHNSLGGVQQRGCMQKCQLFNFTGCCKASQLQSSSHWSTRVQ